MSVFSKNIDAISRYAGLRQQWQILIYQKAEATHLETEHNGALSARERRASSRMCPPLSISIVRF